ncbi:MAG: sulfotransferase family protein [Candidatus Binatia bacterium]
MTLSASCTDRSPNGQAETDSETIAVVSGLPRSGTSMVMQMLATGGMPILTDNIRTADEDNPKGYYELEMVKRIEDERAWLADARGKAVKIVSPLLRYLPAGYRYRIVFVHRAINEVLDSQRQMLLQRGQSPNGDVDMAAVFQRHVNRVKAWLSEQQNMEVLSLSYDAVLRNALEESRRLNAFFAHRLDEQAMAAVVDQQLHRQRRSQ